MPPPLLPTSPPYFTARDLAPLLRRCRSLRQLLQVHSFIIAGGLLDQERGALLGDLIGAASSLGFSDYAGAVFAHKPYPSTRLSNAVISSHSKAGSPEDAVLEFGRIRASGLLPDSYSFPFALRAAARLPGPQTGRQVHCQAIRDGFGSDVHFATALVQFYFATGRFSDAGKAFDEMASSGFLPLWNAMVAGFVRAGEADSAAEVFESMPIRDVISWTTLIAGFSQLNRPKEAVKIFRRMQLEGPKPDEVTMSALLSACAELGALQLGECSHSYVVSNRLHRTVPLHNALIDMYAKSGKIDVAVRVFDSTKRKNVITWTTLIAGLALHGMGREALEMFNQMEQAEIPPNEVTFLAVLSGCCHSGLVETGFQIFEMMHSKYSIKPKIEHYGCMIDLLGRGGLLRDAEEMLRDMPFEPNASIWGSLLAAARRHSDTRLGERALERLVELEPENSGNFALLSNLYAGLGRWDDSGTVRKALRDTGTKKKAAWSSIEVEKEVHEFTAEDRSHARSGTIYEVLVRINGHLKAVGEAGNDEWGWDESSRE